MYLTPFTSLAWAYQLHYYLCFRTHRRRPLFTSKAAQLAEVVSEICARHDYHALEYQPHPDQGKALSDYWLKVATERSFAIDQISVVPDHVHLVVRIIPKMSIEECVLLLMNNGQHFIGKNYPQALVEASINQLWEASVYAGTCGDLTTALIKTWLSTSE